MSSTVKQLDEWMSQPYRHGFVTEVEQDSVPPGLNEDIIRTISARKGEPEFMLEWRLKAYRHWLEMKEPHWAHAEYPPNISRLWNLGIDQAARVAQVKGWDAWNVLVVNDDIVACDLLAETLSAAMRATTAGRSQTLATRS